MTSFPIYDNIEQQLPEVIVELTEEEKDFLTDHITEFNSTEHEIIYALIRYYQRKHQTEEEVSSIFPYGGRKLKKGIKYDVAKLPCTLQHILLTFVRIHLDSLNERMVTTELSSDT